MFYYDMDFYKKSINFAFWNIEGLRLIDDNPKDDDERFISLVKKNDIIGIAETHCSEQDALNIAGYSCFKLSRPIS
jgi:exonuclease III